MRFRRFKDPSRGSTYTTDAHDHEREPSGHSKAYQSIRLPHDSLYNQNMSLPSILSLIPVPKFSALSDSTGIEASRPRFLDRIRTSNRVAMDQYVSKLRNICLTRKSPQWQTDLWTQLGPKFGNIAPFWLVILPAPCEICKLNIAN